MTNGAKRSCSSASRHGRWADFVTQLLLAARPPLLREPCIAIICHDAQPSSLEVILSDHLRQMSGCQRHLSLGTPWLML